MSLSIQTRDHTGVLHIRNFCDTCEMRELAERGLMPMVPGQVITYKVTRRVREELRHHEGEELPWCDGCQEPSV
jgi:hypothetical protein